MSNNNRKFNKRQNYKNAQNDKLVELLQKYKNGEVETSDIVSKLSFKEVIPEVPYFRKTKSGAVACYGVKRESIVLYRDQWMKLSKVFMNGRNCEFNKFFNRHSHNGQRNTRHHNTRNSSSESHQEPEESASAEPEIEEVTEEPDEVEEENEEENEEETE